MESHQKVIKLAIAEALARAGLKDASEVDGIAVTRGPGLEICLRVGIEEAQVSFLSLISFLYRLRASRRDLRNLL
jgi:tRNA A37 threonylcarbamoyltransferase TsaD